MIPMLSDQVLESFTNIVLAIIAIVPTTCTAFWARSAMKSSREAKDNSADAKADSAEAKVNSARALHEVKTNGGIQDPNPNLNDHVKYQTKMTEFLVESMKELREDFGQHKEDFGQHKEDFSQHLEHSAVMDQALAEVYLKVRPEVINWPDDDST